MEHDTRTTKPIDRRSDEGEISEAFSPEYLAMLVICGGTVRDTDWDLLPETVVARRPRPADETVGDTHHDQQDAPSRS